MSSNPENQLDAAMSFRKMLSTRQPYPIEEVIRCGVVPRLVEFLQSPRLDIQVLSEASWALANISVGTTAQTQHIIDAGAVPLLIEMLSSSSAYINKQAIYVLGNIAGDSPYCRDVVLDENAMAPLLNLIRQKNGLPIFRNAVWTLCNLCRGSKPLPKWSQVEPALSVIGELIRSDDEDILSDASWALSYLSMGGNHKIQAVIELGICSRLVELVLRQISSSIQVPVLRTIGNIAGGDQFQTQVIIDCGTLQALHSLLSSPNIDIRRDACMAISNIAAGTASQVQSVLDADIIPPLIDILNNSDFRTRKEACWAIASVTFARNHGQISYLVTLGCIKSFIDILSCEDNKISKVVLDALKNILLCGELHKEETDGVNQFKMNIAECGGVEQIYSLRSHDNADICKRACEITIMYFAKQDENAGLTPQGGSNRTAN
ncbi:armadillo-type protein [Gamsiella multidivaricata]|uniref:armadillo-type protein n=1 Tax=Gamsiella multidivaricata TaxID=101098 RepID=UPI002220C050|nr:armadillo-type protein [Gamsiella multidivaricata]KAI7816119.1 armadillo-type protein [Gamsiella multidivaricata]